ncbi:MAG: NAD(P)-binding domain-containing protein, partial [Clostridia bacterium]|nr:NAD(P)-binding domain-containing protein [Clostridia bacterium]
MKYAIYGVGALGTVLAAYLAEAGEKFDCIVHSDKTAEILNTVGAKVIGQREFCVPVTAVKHTDVTEKYDVVFLLTKQLTNNDTVPEIADMLNPDGVSCTMQNGLPEAQIADVIGKERTFGCTIGWGATNAGPGVSELTSEPVKDALSFGLGSYAGVRNGHFEEIVRI